MSTPPPARSGSFNQSSRSPFVTEDRWMEALQVPDGCKDDAAKTTPTSPKPDAKDADMAFGIAAPGKTRDGNYRSLADFRDQIRQIVAQGLVDIMLMSASTSEIVAIREKMFEQSTVTPAVRANDTTDIHVIRGSVYPEAPSRPFSSATIDHIQAGRFLRPGEIREAHVNLGFHSLTFNNHSDRDLESLTTYKAFRQEAEEKSFNHFLEV